MANLTKPFKVTALGTTALLTCSSDKQIVITKITAQVYVPSSIGYATKTITLNLVDKTGAVYKLQEGTIGYTYNYDGDDTINIYSNLVSGGSSARDKIMDVVVPILDGNTSLDTYKIYLSEGDSLTASISGYNSNLLYITYVISYYELPPSNASKTSSYQGRWVSGTYYQKNSTVFYNKDLYIAINNNTDTTSPSTTNWQIVQKSADTLNVTNLSSEFTLPIGSLETTNRNTLSIAGTLTSKTLTGARFTNNQFLDSTGTYTITIPPSISDTLTTLAATQTLSNKWFTSSTTLNSSTINFSDNNITYGFDGANNIIKEAVIAKTLTSGTNTISLSSTDGMVYSIQTSTTASANFTIAVPAASSYRGLILTFIVKMKAANQTLSFTTVKTARTTTASTTADTFDRYSLISDGTSWYCIQTDKGII
jgi:hypothetical protein